MPAGKNNVDEIEVKKYMEEIYQQPVFTRNEKTGDKRGSGNKIDRQDGRMAILVILVPYYCGERNGI